MTTAAEPDAFHAPLLSVDELKNLLRSGRGLAHRCKVNRDPAWGVAGDRPAAVLGSGLEFAETRPYAPGDDVRKLNWRATARSGRMQVQQYHQDIASQPTCVVDLRASMRFGTRRRLKATQALRLAVIWVAAEAAAGAMPSVLLLTPTPRWLAVAGSQDLFRFANALNIPCPPLAPGGERAPLSGLLAQLGSRAALGSRVQLISDFADISEGDLVALQGFGARYATTLWRVYDQAEKTPPRDRHLRFTGYGSDVEPAQAVGLGARYQAISHRLADTRLTLNEVLAQTDDLVSILNGAHW